MYKILKRVFTPFYLLVTIVIFLCRIHKKGKLFATYIHEKLYAYSYVKSLALSSTNLLLVSLTLVSL